MGDRLSRDGVTGSRQVRPGDAVPGWWDPQDDSALHTVLAAALRADDPGPEAEHRAVAAFRAARDAGAHRARTRHGDDWRPHAAPRTGRQVKTAFAAVFTSIALGGVAVAAIGSAGPSADGTGGRAARPSALAPARPDGETSSASSGGPGRAAGSSSAQDTEARCRAYERVKDRGKVLDATAWQRLVAAAGSEDKVDAYCAERLARSTAEADRSGGPDGPGGAGAGAADPGTGTAGNSGTTGKRNPGNGRPGGGKGE
ncbi:hypothetical protein G3I77_16130 [Streptomyces sp. D2-8]|uniref:hypothetical protein n=1 Tax=Streptomyces sp. D2-8 TaxID=2707767 RepID=UPI0020BD586E|nr:hypothetical protein [Streptomyces sp. D2-8]MCK8434492.1 hypothetical protein [Streptomyces sp. D2-8]